MDTSFARPYVGFSMEGGQIHTIIAGANLEQVVRLTHNHVHNKKVFIADRKRPACWISSNASVYIVQDNRPNTLWYRRIRKDHAYDMIKNVSIEFLNELKALTTLDLKSAAQ